MQVEIKSKALSDAIEHAGGDVDQVVKDLVMTWMGDYEDANTASNWRIRNFIFARNKHRKDTERRMLGWLKREI